MVYIMIDYFSINCYKMLLIQYNHPFNSNKFENLGRPKNSKPKKNATLTLELIKAGIKSLFLLKI